MTKKSNKRFWQKNDVLRIDKVYFNDELKTVNTEIIFKKSFLVHFNVDSYSRKEPTTKIGLILKRVRNKYNVFYQCISEGKTYCVLERQIINIWR